MFDFKRLSHFSTSCCFRSNIWHHMATSGHPQARSCAMAHTERGKQRSKKDRSMGHRMRLPSVAPSAGVWCLT